MSVEKVYFHPCQGWKKMCPRAARRQRYLEGLMKKRLQCVPSRCRECFHGSLGFNGSMWWGYRTNILALLFHHGWFASETCIRMKDRGLWMTFVAIRPSAAGRATFGFSFR